jgi:hypothetical protein
MEKVQTCFDMGCKTCAAPTAMGVLSFLTTSVERWLVNERKLGEF